MDIDDKSSEITSFDLFSELHEIKINIMRKKPESLFEIKTGINLVVISAMSYPSAFLNDYTLTNSQFTATDAIHGF